MIRIFYGPPGAGKSLGAVMDLRDELVFGERLIVTNLPLDLGRLNAYCQKHYPGVDYGDINQRIRLIEEEDIATFFAFRSPGGTPLVVPSKQESMAGKHVCYDGARAVCYYIDEAHIAFDARNWDRTGPELTYYSSQHRKIAGIGDECVFVTQHPDMLEKRLRMLAQEFWSHCNNALERVWSYFQKPAYFHVEHHRKPPTGPNSEKALRTTRYRIDKELADCYDTSAGVGIKGRKMPDKKRKAGLPLLWLLLPIALVAFVAMQLPDMAKHLFRKFTGALDGEPAAQSEPSPGNPVRPVIGTDPRIPPGGEKPAVPPPPPQVVAYAIGKTDMLLTLSDGRVLTRADGVFRITKDHVYLRNGTMYRIRRGKVPPGEQKKMQQMLEKPLTTQENVVQSRRNEENNQQPPPRRRFPASSKLAKPSSRPSPPLFRLSSPRNLRRTTRR